MTRRTMAAIPIKDITGLVLAGGRGTRMGGADKGLQLHRGQPLALHALRRLQPQVSSTMLSANRNLPIFHTLCDVTKDLPASTPTTTPTRRC